MAYKNMNAYFPIAHLGVLIGQLLDLDGYAPEIQKITFHPEGEHSRRTCVSEYAV